MKRHSFALFLSFLLCSISVTTQTLSDVIEIRTFSSETGYGLIPDYIQIIDTRDNSKTFIYQEQDNTVSAELPNGSYLLSLSKNGYKSCQTSFALSGSSIKYDIFLDPVQTDPLLSAARIKSLLNSNSCLLLGYVVDDETGEGLASVDLLDGSNKVLARTNSRGYFECLVPASCDLRTFFNLQFSKLPFETEEYRNFEVFPNTDYAFRVRLKKKAVVKPMDHMPLLSEPCVDCGNQQSVTDAAVTGFVLPLNIRVGRNCTGTNCTYAEVYSLETYCKYVLPAEIYACWGNLSGGMNSLQACAVAVRSYGMYYVYNPINAGLYDICDNTYCQYMGSVTSTNTSNAVDNTAGYILINSSGVVRSEYSAENNNKGCGNGYSGTGSTWPCIYDPVCTNFASNGHGRGLCQWGTVRWATGRIITTSSPCSQGNAHSFGTKTWLEILNHYYSVSPNNWTVTMGTKAVINTSNSVPANTNPCAQITISNSVNSNNTVSLMLGASIAPAGSGNWISDPARDVKLTFSQGTANYNRNFVIPCNTQSGPYDLLTALWYDKNNNNLIDGSDFVVSSKLTPNALTISPIGISIISTEIPKEFALFNNIPNPFNPVTKIRFDIPKLRGVSEGRGVFTRIVIYDLSGKVIDIAVNKRLTPGRYEVDWDGTKFASGVYFYRLETEMYAETKKMILVK